jgi:cytidylate kinase
MKKYVITITREFGSLGRPIARRMSEILGVEYYDRDIVEATSKKMKLPVSVISEEEEKSLHFFKMVFPLGMESTERQDQIFKVQSRIIREIAEKEACIIVGRCSDFILKEEENAIHIYIYAPYESRLRNCVEKLGMKKDEAQKMVSAVDKARKAMHKHYAKYAPNSTEHKDVLINSELLGVEGTAQLLAGIVREKFE